jgi:hypothetical protein
MTLEERAKDIVGKWMEGRILLDSEEHEPLTRAIAAALAEEREACSEVCRADAARWNPYPEPAPSGTDRMIAWSRQQARAQEAIELAAAIRART